MVDIYSVPWNVGAHIPFSKNIRNSAEFALDHGMYTFQIFLGNPQSVKRQRIDEDDINRTNALTKRFPMNIYSHFPYIANLAGKSSKDGIAWSGNSSVDTYLRIVMKEIEYELSVMAAVGKGVVIHPGSQPNRTLGLNAIAKTINSLKFTSGSRLLLENCAGEGNKLCKNFQEIKIILDQLTPDAIAHVGICVDTAHIWGEGDYDLSIISEVERMFNDFDEIIGMQHFRLLHLNDSEVKLGAKKDRHASLGEGHIWKDSYDSLLFLLNKCKKLHIPMVLETKGSDMITLATLSELPSYACKPCNTCVKKPTIECCPGC